MFEYFESGGGNAVEDGIFIPVLDLASLDAAELAAAEPENLKFGKTLNAMLIAITGFADIGSIIGFSASLGDIAGAGGNNFLRTFTFQWQKYLNHQQGSIATIPLPSSGALSGVGGLTIADVFPSAAKVAAAGPVATSGVLVQTSALAMAAPVTQAATDIAADSRLWYAALAEALVTAAPLRSATINSPITAKSRPSISSPAIPAAFTQATDPTTGIPASALDYSSLAQRNLSLSLNYQASPSGESFDVLSATT